MVGITSSTESDYTEGVSHSDPLDSDDATRIDVNSLPDIVRELWESMLRLDPNWDFQEWISDRAEEDLRLMEVQLERERMRLEQRMHRVEAMVRKLRRRGEIIGKFALNDPQQKNLFDIFPPLQKKGVEPTTPDCLDDHDERHPAESLVDYLPGETGDDPLLAICAQLILLHLEDAKATAQPTLSFDNICEYLEKRGVESDEIVEALEWLIVHGEVVEIEEDRFVIGG